MSNTPQFRTDEVALSQLPAMMLLAQMGWKPLTRGQVNTARRGRLSAVILEEITRQYLSTRRITWGKQSASLTEENIDKLIAALKNLPPDTYGKQAEDTWDRLVLPQSVKQNLEGSQRALSVRLIDFDRPEKNLRHAVAEFIVERTRSTETRRLDIVLFVNGIPLAVIENKKAAVDVEQGISQTIRNQKPENIPSLYVYAQLLLSINRNDNRYGTTGTARRLWNTWREQELRDADIQSMMGAEPLSEEDHQAIVGELGCDEAAYATATDPKRLVTDQDRVLAGLCRPDRLLRMVRYFVLFDGPDKVIARFQQVNAVNKALKRIQHHEQGRRSGGYIWHTQGSGKSLTMVMLARALISMSELDNPRIVLVTDRVDLDKQIKGTFQRTGMEPRRAGSGRELAEFIKRNQAGVLTTIINKFEIVARQKICDQSSDIFVLVDESHRSQYGRYHAQMRRVFPHACYLGFTGTPLARKDRSTMKIFGEAIDTYTMRDAVRDGAIVPLIYEGRLVKPDMDERAVDTWFKRLTVDLTEEQKVDLKQKYARANMLSKLDKVISCRAFDISEHFCRNFRGTGLKGQLVAPDKKAALKYKEALDAIGDVNCEVLISSPDTRSGHEEVDEGEADDEVVAFWEQMMQRWGNEEKYNEGLINRFRNGDYPEIIIVVSKLLTGFDAPRNTVLYLTRRFHEAETLLQAVARVNRVLDGESQNFNTDKDAGFIIDYEGVLENLDRAITSYEAMAGYEEQDVQGTFRSATDVLNDIPQKHGVLLDIFRPLGNSADEEAYEQFLRDKEIRDDFYEALYAFSKALSKAFALARFYDETPEKIIRRYKIDLKRFTNLRTAVKIRYGEEIKFKDYEKRIEKLLHDHISATEIKQIIAPVDIFNVAEVNAAETELGSDAARADMIASNLKRVLTERMEENPAFYKELSELLQRLIDDFVNKRLAEADYLEKVRQLRARAMRGGKDDAPAEIAADPRAVAFREFLLTSALKNHKGHEGPVTEFAKFISNCLDRHRVVDMFQRQPVLNRIRHELDDYMYDTIRGKYGIDISTIDMDKIQNGIMAIAQRRME